MAPLPDSGAAPPPLVQAATRLLSASERVAIWVPCVVFAHLYVVFFLFSALARINPKLWTDIWTSARRWFSAATGFGSDDTKHAGSDGDSTVGQRDAQPSVGPKLSHVPKPIVLTWEGVGCAYNSPTGLLHVLQRVHGEARPREMVALMGPSGSGKSTLLDMLAARKTLGHLSGTVYVNGRPRGSGFRRVSSYVPQEDNLTPQMNVVETCQLYTAFTLPRDTTPAQASARIDEVLAAMGMNHARDRLVGGVLPGGLLLRGLSGGERKRLWVAVGILATPSIVFLDEPTSGLDSSAAVAVVNLMRRTAVESGLTIIASIHQPCSAVWSAFDACTLLAHGLLMYHGPCGDMGSWFQDGLGLGPWNPAVHGIVSDWAMDLVSVEFTKPESHGRCIDSLTQLGEAARAFESHYLSTHTRLKALPAPAAAANGGGAYGFVSKFITGSRPATPPPAAAVAASDNDVATDPELGVPAAPRSVVATAGFPSSSCEGSEGSTRGEVELPAANGAVAGLVDGNGKVMFEEELRATWWKQFRTLMWRELLSMMRNPADVAGRMLCFCYLAIFTGLVFWNLDNGLDGTRNRVNVLFMQVMFLLLMPFVYMSQYAQDKRTCIADFSARMYRVTAYYAAKQIAVLPFVCANVIVSTLITIGMIGMRTDTAALVGFFGIATIFYLLAHQMQSLATILTSNQEAAFIASIGYTSVNLLMSNYVIRFQDMQQHWISALRWVSACNYAFSALVQVQFGGTSVSCADGLNPSMVATLQRLMPNTGMLRSTAVQNMLMHPGKDCVMDLTAVLDYFGITYPIWGYVIALLLYLLLVHAMTIAALLMLARKERR